MSDGITPTSLIERPTDRYSKWLYLPRTKQALFAGAKCGSSSLYQYCADVYNVDLPRKARVNWLLTETEVETLTPEEVASLPDDVEKTMYVRNPQARFESLWRNKCRDRNHAVISGVSASGLLDYIILHEGEDVHWTHQRHHWVPGCRLHRIERLGGKRENSTEGECEPYSTIRLLDFYREDLALWRRST